MDEHMGPEKPLSVRGWEVGAKGHAGESSLFSIGKGVSFEKSSSLIHVFISGDSEILDFIKTR